MSGKRGKSGPPGNMHAAIHPWRNFWKRRALKPGDRWVLDALESYGLASDKPDATEAEQRMAELAATARGCWMLILAEARDKGFVRETPNGWDLQPGMKELARFMTVERSALQALGLERRTKDADALDGSYEAYVARREAQEATSGTNDNGNDVDTGRS
jgi:hypothetical protein